MIDHRPDIAFKITVPMVNTIIPDDLFKALPAADFMWVTADRKSTLAKTGGSYILILNVTTTLNVRRPRNAQLPPAWYIYAGSAHGPGGLAARLARHFKRRKRRHWHIDQLTGTDALVAAAAYTEHDECGLIAELTTDSRFSVPIAGFGASDCRTCQSHLLAWSMDRPVE